MLKTFTLFHEEANEIDGRFVKAKVISFYTALRNRFLTEVIKIPK
jgi:hypothetical protein